MKAFAIIMFCIMMFNISLQSCGPKDDDRSPPSMEPVPTHPNDNTTPPPVTPDPGPDPDPTPLPPEEDPEPVPPVSGFKVNVQFYGSQATSARIAKYKRAICIVKKVMDDQVIKDKIMSFDSPYTTNKFYDTSDTNAQVLQHIKDGNETLQPTKDGELDVEVEFYYAATSTVGYTYPSSKRIWVNTKFFDGYTPSSVAANLTHEWLHKLGYKHAVNYSDSRNYSVPYAIGSMVRSLGKPLESKCP